MHRCSSIDEYINFAPMDQRSELSEIRRLIEKNLTKAIGSIGGSGFPVYTISKQWKAGFAYRGQGPLLYIICLLYTSPSPRDLSTSRMPSSA